MNQPGNGELPLVIRGSTNHLKGYVLFPKIQPNGTVIREERKLIQGFSPHSKRYEFGSMILTDGVQLVRTEYVSSEDANPKSKKHSTKKKDKVMKPKRQGARFGSLCHKYELNGIINHHVPDNNIEDNRRRAQKATRTEARIARAQGMLTSISIMSSRAI
jgi:hypothetical protein